MSEMPTSRTSDVTRVNQKAGNVADIETLRQMIDSSMQTGIPDGEQSPTSRIFTSRTFSRHWRFGGHLALTTGAFLVAPELPERNLLLRFDVHDYASVRREAW
jgi:hypothetical protein